MYIEDGSEIKPESWWTYERLYHPDKVYIAVGWLEDAPIPTGETPAGLVEMLLKVADSRHAAQMRGYHWCTYCADTDDPYVIPNGKGKLLHLGSAEIWVPGKGNIVYCAPNLIIHYIRDHSYKPPQEFIDAVMSVPEFNREASSTDDTGEPAIDPSVRSALEAAGWHEEYFVADEVIQQWIATLDGFHLHKAARAALKKYGGIRALPAGQGQGATPSNMSIDPSFWGSESKNSFKRSSKRLGKELFPLGSAGRGSVLLAIADDGFIYSLMDDTIAQVGEDIIGAFENVLLGRPGTRVLDDH